MYSDTVPTLNGEVEYHVPVSRWGTVPLIACLPLRIRQGSSFFLAAPTS
jgi:hypothetical protein